jgi:hypothetical protein
LRWQRDELFEIAERTTNHHYDGSIVTVTNDLTTINNESLFRCRRLKTFIMSKLNIDGDTRSVRIIDYDKIRIGDDPPVPFDNMLSKYCTSDEAKERILEQPGNQSSCSVDEHNQHGGCMFIF